MRIANMVEDPQPPNCIHNVADFQYQGTQWTSTGELPCIPWIAEEVVLVIQGIMHIRKDSEEIYLLGVTR